MFANDEVQTDFKVEHTKAFLKEMYDHMRAIGVKIPITGTNWAKPGHGLARAHMEMDYTDSHMYTYDWNWGVNERCCKNMHVDHYDNIFCFEARTTLAGKPFYLSEWDMPWPNSFRAEGAIHYAATAALQGWGGACIHTYAYSAHLEDMKILGRELSSPVKGIPYREGIFSTWNDPAKFGLFYHAALITRRGDVSKSDKKVAIIPHDPYTNSSVALRSLRGKSQGRMHYGEGLPEGYDMSVLTNEAVPDPNPNMVVSDNGQLWWDKDKTLWGVDTERTKAFYGMIGNGSRPKHVMNGLEIQCATDFGVIALSSLTDDPIETSDNILLSTIGRARNTDAQFDGEKMIDIGKPPILAEVIDVKIRLKNIHGTRMKVWAVNAEGFYALQKAVTYDDEGYLNFHLGSGSINACYYLIVKE